MTKIRKLQFTDMQGKVHTRKTEADYAYGSIKHDWRTGARSPAFHKTFDAARKRAGATGSVHRVEVALSMVEQAKADRKAAADSPWERQVRELEAEGLDRSDAQAAADAERGDKFEPVPHDPRESASDHAARNRAKRERYWYARHEGDEFADSDYGKDRYDSISVGPGEDSEYELRFTKGNASQTIVLSKGDYDRLRRTMDSNDSARVRGDSPTARRGWSR